jgi:hypothetical protein
VSEQKQKRKNRKRKRHIGSGSHYNTLIEDFKNLNNIDQFSIDIQKKIDRDNNEALRDLRLLVRFSIS